MRRTNVVWSVFLLTSAWATGPSRAGIESCPDIADDKQRLACFDRESALAKQRTRAPDAQQPAASAPAVPIPAAPTPAASTPAASTPAAPAQAASTPAASTPAASTPAASTPAASTPAASTQAAGTQLTPEQRMGLTPGRILQLQGSQTSHDLKEMTAKVQYVSERSDGRGWFTLDNGQVWREVSPDPYFRVRPGDTVRISRGLLGSYFMSVSTHMNTRVSRAH